MPVDYDIIGSDNGLSPALRQAIIWTNADILPIGPLKTNVIEIWIIFIHENVYLKISSSKWRLFCIGLNMFV